jgi:hypothetical protein
VIRKDGGVPGFGSMITVYPSQGVGIAILCNREVTETSDNDIDNLISAIDQVLMTPSASK